MVSIGGILGELVSSLWSTARYHALYSPQSGFELQVQWMVSTGGILGELVNSQWSTARYHALYSPQCGFELQGQ